jgi:hypothetical protein
MVRFLWVLPVVALVSLASFGIILVSLSLPRQSRLSELENEKTLLQSRVNEARSLVSGLGAELESSQERLAPLEGEVSLLRSATRYELHDPTYGEVTRFLAADRTNTIPYDEENFVCLDYAVTVKNHAEEQGLRCAVAIVRLSKPPNHAIVAFRIKDLDRLCYFEPQLDVGVGLQVGWHYWGECVPNTVGSDDIVENWELYW